jgi:glycolate oxidase iron-sulfur subunit
VTTEPTTVSPGTAIDLASGQLYADACTHCGLCLESCPTYTLWGQEPDSPRGRIVQIEDAILTGGSVSAEMATHIDSCLGCMACVTACPEHVQYDQLIARARVTVARERELSVAQRLQRGLGSQTRARSGRLRTLLGGARTLPRFTPASGTTRGRVGLLLGCTQRAAHPAILTATLGVLAAEGYDVIAPTLPECCGAVALHDGERDPGLRRAQATIDAFTAVGGVDHVVVSAGACGAAMKGYGETLNSAQARAFSALVLDIHELLARAPSRAPLGALSLRVAYHDACQLRHAQGIAQAPRELLGRIPGLRLLELAPQAGACCGGPGTYAMTQPAAASSLSSRQAQAIIDSGAEIVVSGDHACLHQLSGALQKLGHRLSVHHPMELLWSSIQVGARERS